MLVLLVLVIFSISTIFHNDTVFTPRAQIGFSLMAVCAVVCWLIAPPNIVALSSCGLLLATSIVILAGTKKQFWPLKYGGSAGMMMNFLALAANNWKMPVLLAANEEVFSSARHFGVVSLENANFPLLIDRFNLPLIISGTFSVGDAILSLAILTAIIQIWKR